jgi:hypothetical protein
VIVHLRRLSHSHTPTLPHSHLPPPTRSGLCFCFCCHFDVNLVVDRAEGIRWRAASPSGMTSSPHVSTGSGAVAESLLTSIEESVSQLCLPSSSSPDTALVVSSTIRSIQSLLRSSSSSSLLPPPSSSSPSLAEGLHSALSGLFQSLLLSRQYDGCLSLLSLLPTTPSASPASSVFVSLRFDLLRRLVLGLSQSPSLSLLTELDFGSSLTEVLHVLDQQAQHSDLNLSDPSNSSSSAPRYYDLLYSVLIFHSQQPLIARSQFHFARRVQAEADLSNPHILSLYIHALQRSFNALSLMEDAVISVPHNGGALVLSRAHLHQRLQAAVAQMDLLAVSAAPKTSFISASPVALIEPLLRHDLLDRAVSVAAAMVEESERRRAFEILLAHLVGLLSREVTSSERAVFHVEDHRVLKADEDGFFPPSSSSPTLHCLRSLLLHYDDSSLHLRTFTLSRLLSSPLSLTIPHWLLSHRPIALAYNSGSHPVDVSSHPAHPTVDAFAAVTRTLLKANRLDLAVEGAVKWLEDRQGSQGRERVGGLGAGRLQKVEEAGVEWNVMEDLVLRLQQARKLKGLDAKAEELVTVLHGTLMKALA